MSNPPTPADTEGTIRFAYALEPPEGPVADPDTLAALKGWRAVLKRLGMLGAEPGRYGGLGFGNVSARCPRHPGHLLITASQTSGAEALTDDDLVRVTGSDANRFWVDAQGRQPPSSETLTHAMVYGADPAVGWVFHGHSPDVWQAAQRLKLPAVPAHVVYGSAAMAAGVADLLDDRPRRPLVFVTLGHQDGVFACGASADETGAALVGALARALT